MPVSITSRHLSVDDSIEDYIRKKLPRFEKYTDKLQKVDVVIEKDRYNHKVEVRLKAGPTEVHATVKDPDLMRAIDLLADKVERQLKKKWECLRKNKKHVIDKSPRSRAARATAEVEAEEESPAVAAKGKSPKRSGKRGGRELPIYLEGLHVRIFPTKQLDTNPMSIEHAAEELYFSDENFLCFVNDGDGQLNVLYRRRDGNFGLIEPIF